MFLYFFVTVVLLHCSSFCHENKFLICVNIPGNKADSDSVSVYLMLRYGGFSYFFLYYLFDSSVFAVIL